MRRELTAGSAGMVVHYSSGDLLIGFSTQLGNQTYFRSHLQHLDFKLDFTAEPNRSLSAVRCCII
ncbi:hypothetical protein Mapa_013747 [Marchantia paleacea]|nr:hypothetical protein Mapa_013747 [Marchantia paleacea]